MVIVPPGFRMYSCNARGVLRPLPSLLVRGRVRGDDSPRICDQAGPWRTTWYSSSGYFGGDRVSIMPALPYVTGLVGFTAQTDAWMGLSPPPSSTLGPLLAVLAAV